MERYKVIASILSSLEDDLRKFYEKDNAAAGTRARNQLKEIKRLSQELRMDIQRKKNSKK